MQHTEETLARDLVTAGIESIRRLGGDDLVDVMLRQPGMAEFRFLDRLPERVPIADFLRYRDAVIEMFQDAFPMTSFQTGQLMVELLQGSKQGGRLLSLIDQFRHSANPLVVVGQAAILAAAGNPGTVRARLDGDALLISIEECPECRGLRREAPICYLNQGVTTEFARRYLNMEVRTEEIRCSALGHPCCEFRVTRVH